ncbi:PH domain-containing protein [Roseateles oligotrophus]|uniref:PH domain-containing protein n=1 Tax=Roseateles oligotrophus TaxID=1769250 RepID=A0ABT2YEA9_9BURK|nr:PH domain-containing protein [Roseateles oligotrophus]MCV2368356.1 PH domain-containing protein [Roseateles oligotrophus]
MTTTDSQATVHTITRMPTLLRYWRWHYGLMGALPGLALAAVGLVRAYPMATASGLALCLAGSTLACLYAGQRFAHYRAELHEGEGVVLHSGVWWRSEVWVPTARLQHLDVSQGPLGRRWGMAILSLHTAGSHDHHTRIHGLPLAEAHALRERLLPRQYD